MSALVRFKIRPPAGVITLTRADKRNALSRALIRELTSAIVQANDDPKVRCIVLAAEGPVFCAGMDLGELQATVDAPTTAEAVWTDALELAKLFDAIYRSPKPSLAVVEGPAVAGGAGLTTVCDLAIATPAAKFGYPEVRRGLVAAMVMPHLLRHVGERCARHLLLTGELIDAAEAKTCGLINEVVEPGEIWKRANALAEALAAGGPKALAQTKTLLAMSAERQLGVEEAARGSAEPRLTDERKSGLAAFFEKKNPPWMKGS